MNIIEVPLDEREYKIGALVDEHARLYGNKPFVVCDRNLERVDNKSYETVAFAMSAAESVKGLLK